MRTIKLILFTVLFSYSALSQSKEETEEWINQNINYYPVSYGDSPIGVEQSIFIENGFLYFYHHWERNDENYYSGSWDKVGLKDIKGIEYSYDKSLYMDNNRWIEIHLNFEKGRCYSAKMNNGYQRKEAVSYKLSYERTAIIKRLNIDFVNSGMNKRIEKALLHIIKLYGGNALIKKESF